MALQQDPYYEIRPVLENAVSKIAKAISKQDPPLSQTLVSQYLSRVKKLQRSNGQLRTAIEAAAQRQDEMRYKHIDSQEVASRNRFVEGITKRLNDIETFLTNTKSGSGSPRVVATTGTDVGSSHASPFQSINQRRGASESASPFEQESLLRDSISKQNEDIDYIADRVNVINEHARAISVEVDSHNKMLGEMSEAMDKLNDTFDQVNGKIGEFVQTKDNCIVKVILYLSITAVVLLLLLIFV